MTSEQRLRHLRMIASKGGKIGFERALAQSMYSDAGHMIEHWIEIGRLSKRPKKG